MSDGETMLYEALRKLRMAAETALMAAEGGDGLSVALAAAKKKESADA